MPTNSSPQIKTWIPTRPPSEGADAYHKAVIETSWHINNIEELKNILRKNINDAQTVVDFGAGTGASALLLLKDLQKDFRLLLVDNSPSWLTKAYEILQNDKRASFHILEKTEGKYALLNQLFGEDTIDHVFSANTVHLIPPIEETFKGIYSSLRKNGSFIFQSGNIASKKRKKGVLMIDDSINEIHDIAIKLVKENSRFKKYRATIEERLISQLPQRRFVFPTPRPVDLYTQALRSAGFTKNIDVSFKPINVLFKDWLAFVKVRRLQAGILPEIGGKDATPEEETDRDTLITKAALLLFKKLAKENPLANKQSFTAEWTYVSTIK